MLKTISISVLALFLTLMSHEGSHYVANKAVGREITSSKLYPHFYKDRFYFARVSSKGDPSGLKWVHASPVIKSVVLIGVYVGLALSVSRYFFLFLISELIDTVWWFKGFFFGPEHFDGAKFKAAYST